MTALDVRLLTRRQALRATACGFGYLALAGLARSEAADPLAPKVTPLKARARRVIFLCMQGGPSHVDTFDYKPRLARDHGVLRPFDDARTLAKTGKVVAHSVMKSPWQFRRHGASGRWVSELFPHLAGRAD